MRDETSRVLIVVEPGMDGVFRHVEGLCDALLEDEKIRIALAYSDIRSCDALHMLVTKVQEYGGITCNLGISNTPSLRDLKALVILVKLICEFRPHIIHSHSSKAGALARMLWFAGFDVCQMYTPNAYYGLNNSVGIKALIYNTIESLLGGIGHSINVSICEQRFARNILALPPSALFSIHNAVDCDRFHPPTQNEKSELRALLGVPDKAWVFGAVGRYSKQKDPWTLYKTVDIILSEFPDAWFTHLGEGEAYEEIDGFISKQPWADRVLRIRYQRDPADFYRVLDAFVLASLYEGLPISAIEALATGLPLALTRCPGCLDFATLGFTGISWGGIQRPNELADAVRATRKINYRKMNHRERALELFSPKVIFTKVRMCYSFVQQEQNNVIY